MSVTELESPYWGRIVIDTERGIVYVERHPPTGQPARLTLKAMRLIEGRHEGTSAKGKMLPVRLQDDSMLPSNGKGSPDNPSM